MAYTKVVIIGAGFGGIKVALALGKVKEVDILVIDKTNHHLFQPLLYQVATAALSSNNIATPIREILRNQANTSVVMDEVLSIDPSKKTIFLLHGEAVRYDYLVVATGASHTYFDHPEWEVRAPGLKTLFDAVKIREHLLLSFEQAEKCDSIKEAQKFLRFVIIGGGPTGVEMAGAIAEIARQTMFKNFRKIKPENAEIYLIEGLPHILPAYPMKLRLKAEQDLRKMGVKVLTNTKVTNITEEGVWMDDQWIQTPNIIWAAGNKASALLKTLNVPLDKQGRVIVNSDLTIPNYPEVFVIGDAASVADPKWGTLPGVAPVAMQEGKYVAKIIAKHLPQNARKAFKYFDKGSMATIGKAKAVASIGKLNFSGISAWLTWCFVHVLYLITFRNRFIVMIQWMFWYLTGKRNVRIITRSVDQVDSKE